MSLNWGPEEALCLLSCLNFFFLGREFGCSGDSKRREADSSCVAGVAPREGPPLWAFSGQFIVVRGKGGSIYMCTRVNTHVCARTHRLDMIEHALNMGAEAGGATGGAAGGCYSAACHGKHFFLLGLKGKRTTEKEMSYMDSLYNKACQGCGTQPFEICSSCVYPRLIPGLLVCFLSAPGD